MRLWQSCCARPKVKHFFCETSDSASPNVQGFLSTAFEVVGDLCLQIMQSPCMRSVLSPTGFTLYGSQGRGFSSHLCLLTWIPHPEAVKCCPQPPLCKGSHVGCALWLASSPVFSLQF